MQPGSSSHTAGPCRLGYLAGCLLVAALLAWSHVDIARRGLPRVGMRFMTVNGVVGLIYGVVAIVAVLISS